MFPSACFRIQPSTAQLVSLISRLCFQRRARSCAALLPLSRSLCFLALLLPSYCSNSVLCFTSLLLSLTCSRLLCSCMLACDLGSVSRCNYCNVIPGDLRALDACPISLPCNHCWTESSPGRSTRSSSSASSTLSCFIFLAELTELALWSPIVPLHCRVRRYCRRSCNRRPLRRWCCCRVCGVRGASLSAPIATVSARHVLDLLIGLFPAYSVCMRQSKTMPCSSFN